jgi:hypothetical protein
VLVVMNPFLLRQSMSIFPLLFLFLIRCGSIMFRFDLLQSHSSSFHFSGIVSFSLPLKGFLRLYHTVLPLYYLQTPILTCTFALANLKTNVSVFTHNLLDSTSPNAFVHHCYYSRFSPLTSGIIHL